MDTLVDVDRHLRAILWLGIGRIPFLGHLNLAGLHLQDRLLICHVILRHAILRDIVDCGALGIR